MTHLNKKHGFRTWKSGKKWLTSGAVVITILSGPSNLVGAAETISTVMSTPSKNSPTTNKPSATAQTSSTSTISTATSSSQVPSQSSSTTTSAPQTSTAQPSTATAPTENSNKTSAQPQGTNTEQRLPLRQKVLL